jgi:hypothetical protein
MTRTILSKWTCFNVLPSAYTGTLRLIINGSLSVLFRLNNAFVRLGLVDGSERPTTRIRDQHELLDLPRATYLFCERGNKHTAVRSANMMAHQAQGLSSTSHWGTQKSLSRQSFKADQSLPTRGLSQECYM